MDYFSAYPGTEMDAAIAQAQAYKHPITIWNAGAAYEAGVIVTIPGDTKIYQAPVGGVAIGVIPPAAPWTVIAQEENAGRIWNASVAYKAGDIVTSTINRELYTAQFDVTGGLDPTATPTDWKMSVDTTEKGGILWATGTDYVVGDIVSDAGVGYICNINHTSTTLLSNIGFWDTLKAIERGGRLFSTTLQYLAGDAVTDANGKLFIANKDTTGAWSGADWDYVSDQAGKLWDVSISYKVGDLVTSNTANYPVYVCVIDIIGGMDPSNPASAGEWRLIKSNERGGVAWKTLVFYQIGDIVSENGLTYICIEDHQAGVFQDDFDNIIIAPLNSKKWTYAVAERGGIEYSGFTQYKTGDTVSQGRDIWIALTDNLGITPDGINPEWFLATGDERGGVAWDADRPYVLGDLVTHNEILYVCVAPHVGDPFNPSPDLPPPVTVPVSPDRWITSSTPAGTADGDVLIWEGAPTNTWVAKAQIRYNTTANGLDSAFIPAPALEFTEADVFVNGSLQEPGASYTLTVNATPETIITFISPPPAAAWIRVNTLA